MFSDSVVASQFQLCPNKLTYVTNWGIGPQSRQLLLTKLDSASFIALRFHESMNESTDTCHIDLVVPFGMEQINK